MSYGGKGIPLHSISTSPKSGNRSDGSSTEYDSSESSEDDVGGPPPMLPRRGKTYAKLVTDNSDLIKKKPPMPRRGNTYASLVGRKKDLLMGGRVRSAVVKSPRTRDTRPSHQRKSTGSMLTEDTMKPPPLPPRKSSRNDTPIKTSRKKILPRAKTPPLKSEPMDELPVVYVASVSSSYFTHTFNNNSTNNTGGSI